MTGAPLILVVDDQQSEAERLGAALRQRYPAAQCEWLADCRRLVARLERGLPRVVILDLVMPLVDGYQALLEIRARWPRLPVIMFSRSEEEVPRALCEKYGADLFLRKPDSAHGYALVSTYLKALIDGDALAELRPVAGAGHGGARHPGA